MCRRQVPGTAIATSLASLGWSWTQSLEAYGGVCQWMYGGNDQVLELGLSVLMVLSATLGCGVVYYYITCSTHQWANKSQNRAMKESTAKATMRDEVAGRAPYIPLGLSLRVQALSPSK